MTKTELQLRLAEATQTDKKTAGVFLDTLSNLAYKEIRKNGEFVLPGFRETGQYQVVVEIVPRYRGSFSTPFFGEIKPHSGSLMDGRLNLVYDLNPGLNIGDPFSLWTFH